MYFYLLSSSVVFSIEFLKEWIYLHDFAEKTFAGCDQNTQKLLSVYDVPETSDFQKVEEVVIYKLWIRELDILHGDSRIGC